MTEGDSSRRGDDDEQKSPLLLSYVRGRFDCSTASCQSDVYITMCGASSTASPAFNCGTKRAMSSSGRAPPDPQSRDQKATSTSLARLGVRFNGAWLLNRIRRCCASWS